MLSCTKREHLELAESHEVVDERELNDDVSERW